MLCGFFTSFLIPETARKTLEELGGEDEDVELVRASTPTSSERMAEEGKA